MADRPKPPGTVISDLVKEYVEEHGRLGFGDLTTADTEQWVSRVMLFHLMRTMCKLRIATFRQRVLPLYVALFDAGRQQMPESRADFPQLIVASRPEPHMETTSVILIDSWSNLCTALQIPEARALWQGIISWVKEQHMPSDWFCDAALFNLRCWHLQPPGHPMPEWSYPGSVFDWRGTKFGGTEPKMLGAIKGLAELGPPPPTIPIFNPAMQTSQDHMEEIRKLLENYHAAQIRLFSAVGFKETNEVRRRAGDRLTHMRWFISFQICRRSADQIADEHRPIVTAPAITKAVRKIGELANTLAFIELRRAQENLSLSS